MKKNKSAVLFYARDHLSREFSKLGSTLGGVERVYVVSKYEEAVHVIRYDDNAIVYNIGDYIESVGSIDEKSNQYLELFELVAKDRYLKRMNVTEISKVVTGVSNLLDDLQKEYNVLLYIDEPVSGFINEALNRWVKDQGGTAAHYNLAWVPGYIFFVSDSAEAEPIALNMLGETKAVVDSHISQRMNNQNQPRYIFNYNSPWKRAKSCIEFFAKGWFRRIKKSDLFLDRDPWPHFYQASSLARSFLRSYPTIDKLGFNDSSKLVIFPMHYEPEAVISYFSPFTNQLDLANKLFETLPAGAVLVIKEHPSQPGATGQVKWRELISNKRVIVVSGLEKLSDLLIYQSVVVSIGSKAALEASLVGTASYVVGKPHFYRAPGVTYIENISDIAYDWGGGRKINLELGEWYADFLASYCVKGQFIRNSTYLEDSYNVLNKLLKNNSL